MTLLIILGYRLSLFFFSNAINHYYFKNNHSRLNRFSRVFSTKAFIVVAENHNKSFNAFCQVSEVVVGLIFVVLSLLISNQQESIIALMYMGIALLGSITSCSPSIEVKIKHATSIGLFDPDNIKTV